MARSLRGERLPERLLSPAELEAALAERPEWLLSGDGTAIVKTFTFADFSAAFSFMTRVAMIAERSASGAEPKTRRRERPPSVTLFSISDACLAPAQMIGAA